jgi:F420-dependent methylenetetrahydromethanopterin dehydrogenase
VTAIMPDMETTNDRYEQAWRQDFEFRLMATSLVMTPDEIQAAQAGYTPYTELPTGIRLL